MTVSIFSYVVARDFGFAPNPFGGFCTLATCKPEIRRLAEVGDWVFGTGSATWNRKGSLVYAMRVAEMMSFDQYWDDLRFRQKKPDLRSCRKSAYGDNIYHRGNGSWIQLDSHHSLANGAPNLKNIRNDTQTNRVLISTQFAYWGGSGPLIPQNLRNYDGCDLCAGRGYKRKFPQEMEEQVFEWFLSLKAQGCLGRPINWTR